MTIEPRLLRREFSDISAEFGDEYLEGVDAIAKYLGWNTRKARYARETGALPIRVKNGVGLYAFKSGSLRAIAPLRMILPASVRFEP